MSEPRCSETPTTPLPPLPPTPQPSTGPPGEPDQGLLARIQSTFRDAPPWVRLLIGVLVVDIIIIAVVLIAALAF